MSKTALTPDNIDDLAKKLTKELIDAKNSLEVVDKSAVEIFNNYVGYDDNTIGYIAGALCEQIKVCYKKKTAIKTDINRKLKDLRMPVLVVDNTGKSWADNLLDHVLEFNKTHASVMIGGRHRIMRTTPADASHEKREKYEFIRHDDMKLIYANTTILAGHNPKTGDPVYKNHYLAWAEHPQSQSYKGAVIFSPGLDAPDGYFNTWKGYAVEPQKNSQKWALIKHHIEEIICDGKQELIDYFYNWQAYTLQKPHEPAMAACVVRGEKGTGKGILGHFIRKIWGNHGIHLSSARHLTGNFNGHLADVCFVFADEAFFAGDKQGVETLKALITEPTLMTERKGIDAEQQPNYLKIMMFTNNDFSVNATRDERRFAVFDVSSDAKGNNNYFKELLRDCNDSEVQAAFLYDMLNRDISNFYPSNIPETQGLKAQRIHSLCPIAQWLLYSFHTGYLIGESWKERLTNPEIQDSFLTYCDKYKAGEFKRPSPKAITQYLGKVGYSTGHDGYNRGCTFGIFQNAVEKFEQYEKITVFD